MKRSFILLGILAISFFSKAQSPEKFNYQAIIHDSQGHEISEQSVGIQISIIQTTIDGTVVYVEQFTKTTNSYGLVNLEIGAGNVQDGTFSGIDWGNEPYFIRVEVDKNGGDAFTDMGTTQLLSVPYALYSESAGDYNETDPLFSASDASGITTADINDWDNKLALEVDGSTSNELQTLSLDEASLSISAGNSVDLPISPWQKSSTDIYYNSGKVGIGADSPTAMLEIFDNIGYHFIKFQSEDNVYTTWSTSRLNADDYMIGIDGGNDNFVFANLSGPYYSLVLHDDMVGIGTLFPEATLHINDFMKLEPRSAAPSSPTEGIIYYDSTDKKVKVYTGSAWENLN